MLIIYRALFFRVYVFSFKHSRLANFLKVMQTLDCVSGSHNFLKFSQPPLVFRWEYVNMEKRFSIPWAVIGSNKVFQAYLLRSKKNYLLHFNSTTTPKTFSQSNNSSPGQFLQEHLLTSLMAGFTFINNLFCGQQSMTAGLYEKRSLNDRATVTHWNSLNMVTFKGFCIKAVWQTRLFCPQSINRE